MKTITLKHGQKTIVDDEDYEIYNKYKWHLISGYVHRSGKRINGKQSHVFLHRLILNTPKGMKSDHINGNRLDNRRCNLRICTDLQNARNHAKRKDNKSGANGVYWHGAIKRWAVQIRVNSKAIYLGSFVDKNKAIEIYNINASKYFGEFARK